MYTWYFKTCNKHTKLANKHTHTNIKAGIHS